MRQFLLAAALCLPAIVTAQDCISEFHLARQAGQSGSLEAAAKGMQQSFRSALEEGNIDYATAAGASACDYLYRDGKSIESGKFARTVLVGLQPFSPDDAPLGDALRRAGIFGYLERGLAAEGKLGAAWQANRAGAETLRGRKVGPDADGAPITLQEILAMPPGVRDRGWRCLERESDFMDLAGRTVEAKALLDSAANHLLPRLNRLTEYERFYAFKTLESRTMLLDFLGYEAEAIDASRKLLAFPGGSRDLEMMRLNLQLNLLRNLSQWEGPSEKILAEARAIGAQLKEGRVSRSVDRLLAKMELDLRESREALDTLRADAVRHAAEGYEMEALYAARDSLVARAKRGEANLDSEYAGLLDKLRTQGNKRGEPNLYRVYGGYLLDQKRPAEAMAMFTESLRLTRSFGWILHEPSLLHALFEAKIATGDLAGARAVLAELEAFLKWHPDLPAARRSLALNCIALQRAGLGDKDGARRAYAEARAAAKDLPAYQQRWITPEAEAKALAEAPAALAAASGEGPAVRLQPLEVLSTAAPGQPGRTRFTVFNPAAAASGTLLVEGPGAVADKSGESLSFDAGKPRAKLSIPRTLAAGAGQQLPVTIAAAKGVDSAEVSIAWQSAGRATVSSTWTVDWTPDAKSRVVLDASLLETNPFRSVSLFHEIRIPFGEFDAVPFRLRSPAVLRFEYYDPRNGDLLAIDANGNGDFTEAGDLHFQGKDGVAAALIEGGVHKMSPAVEVRIFAGSGEPLPVTAPLILQSEVYDRGAWVTEAENVLR